MLANGEIILFWTKWYGYVLVFKLLAAAIEYPRHFILSF